MMVFFAWDYLTENLDEILATKIVMLWKRQLHFFGHFGVPLYVFFHFRGVATTIQPKNAQVLDMT